MSRGTRPVRIANCSGFYGDRMTALAEQVRGGEVDVITGDYLAEVTMLILAKVRAKRPEQGYATTFLRQLEPVINDVAERGIKIVVNAGGLNPAGLADATRALVDQHGLALRVAHVEGDDITDRLGELQDAGHRLTHVDTGADLSSWGNEPVCANGYLGGFGVARALEEGADIVVTGRITDAAMVVGTAAWWWGWSTNDHDRIAGSVAAGHVIECGAQATGGNFSGFRAMDDLLHPGFPIAEIDDDGSSIITKHPGTGGAVTVDTVTAQLLYEVGAPAYLNPDVVTHLDTLRLEQRAPDAVAMSGVRGSAPPPTTKVSICAIDGWRNSVTLVLTGLDVEAKARLARDVVEAKFADREGVDELRFELIGRPVNDPADQLDGSCLFHIAIRGDENVVGRAFSSAVTEIGLSNFPGYYGTSPPGAGSSRGVYWPGLVDQAVLEQTVVLDDGSRIAIDPPDPAPPEGVGHRSSATTSTDADTQQDHSGAEEPSTAIALGELFDARSGDKGGNANVGIWSRDPLAFEWLRDHLDERRLVEMFPELGRYKVHRHVFENLGALNFVVVGILDEGAMSTLRFDKQAKALGEWLRSRVVAVPSRLLDHDSSNRRST